MDRQVLNIIFSLSLLPLNLCCSFWTFKEALNLTGMTFKEFLENVSMSGSSHQARRKKQRFLVSFFSENSTNPSESLRLLAMYAVFTMLGFVALVLALFGARNITYLKYVFIGNIILLLLNILLLLYKNVYKRNHPLDEKLVSLLESKKEGIVNKKSIIVYIIVGAFFFMVLLGFHLAAADISNTPKPSISYQDVNTVLVQNDFETANIKTTYWFYDENKLVNVCAGIKDDIKFEFYEYSDGKTIDMVYNQIIRDISSNNEINQQDINETKLSKYSKMVTVVNKGVYYLVIYKDNTVIYANSSSSFNEINNLLFKLGYLKG